MAVTLTLKSISEQPDGSFIIAVDVLRDTDPPQLIGEKTAHLPAGGNKDTLKDLIRPHLQTLVADETRRDQLRTLAQAAIDELLNEVTP